MLFQRELLEMKARGIKEFVVREAGHKNLYYSSFLKAKRRIYKLSRRKRKGIILKTVF